MCTTAILNQARVEIEQLYNNKSLYPTVTLSAIPYVYEGMADFEIQVCDGSAFTEENRGGSFIRVFVMPIAIFCRYQKDTADRTNLALSDVSKSILVKKEVLVPLQDADNQFPDYRSGLQGTVLNSLLVRPLMYMGEDATVRTRVPGILMKVMRFQGGVITNVF